MDATIETRAGADARRDLAAHPARSTRHEEALRTYLGAAAYAERRRRHAEDEEPQPVDEPVAQKPDARRRR